jgi:hypothetical protein
MALSAPTKKCFKCNEVKPLTEFYPHPKMADGHLNKCKTCTKNDVKHRYDRLDGVHEYEHERAQRPERRANRVEYGRTHRKLYPEKARARTAVSNGLRDGKITKGPCVHCGTTEKVQAHHHDYSKPLDVEWVCFKCHREREHGQKIRGARHDGDVAQ